MESPKPPSSPGMSRRTVLRGAGAVGFVGVSAAVLPIFGTHDRKQNPATCTTKDLSNSQKELIVSN